MAASARVHINPPAIVVYLGRGLEAAAPASPSLAMFASDGVTDGRWAPHGTTAVSPALRSARGSGPPPGPPVGVDDYGPPATEVRRSTALTSPPAHRERRRAPTRTACDTTPARGLAAGPILCGYTTLGRPPVPLSPIDLSLALSLCARWQSLGQKARDPLPQCSETEKEGATPRPTDQSACSTPHDEKAPPRHSLLRLPSLRKAFRSGHKSSRML